MNQEQPQPAGGGPGSGPGGKKARIVIAGATGFIGSALCRELVQDYEVVALTRSRARSESGDPSSPVSWRCCDLFSASEVRAALSGADYALFLVHSLVPTTRLSQAKPEDLDLLLADNFGRAATHNRVKQIMFIGGIIPQGFEISRLLWSRREVELALGSYGTPVTSLRAGLVVGPGGSSLGMLVRLVRRLPVLPTPLAAASRVQPIALSDVLRAVRFCLGNPAVYFQHFDIGGPEILTYREILRRTAMVMGKRRLIFRVPLLPRRLGAFFIWLVTGAHSTLVRALVESMPQDTLVQENPVQQAIAKEALSYTDALAKSLDAQTGRMLPSPHLLDRDKFRADVRDESVVRSIQRFILPVGQDAAWVAGNYFRWLPRLLWPFVACRFDAQGSCGVYVRFPRVHLLTLTFRPERSTSGRQIYAVTSGLLLRNGAQQKGRFEFRDVLNGRFTIAGIHDYPPAIPWYVYIWTQAVIHLSVMRLYQSYLARLAR